VGKAERITIEVSRKGLFGYFENLEAVRASTQMNGNLTLHDGRETALEIVANRSNRGQASHDIPQMPAEKLEHAVGHMVGHA
jgi:hypothetical protein